MWNRYFKIFYRNFKDNKNKIQYIKCKTIFVFERAGKGFPIL